jgi:hypothetical protein
MKITKEYIINTHYNGIHPTCKCGCGTLLSFKPLKNGPWFPEYTKNHAPKKKHTEETKKKIRESCKKKSIELFGVENPFQSDEIKHKIRQTNLQKYGVENYTQTDAWKQFATSRVHTPETRRKIQKTNQAKYGANSFTASSLGKLQARKKLITRWYGSWEIYLDKLQNNHVVCNTTEDQFYTQQSIEFSCQLCGTVWTELGVVMPICDVCQTTLSMSGRSKLEESLFSWLTSIGISFIPNKVFTNECGKKYSIDAFIPDMNVGIEMNGLWWHSELHGKKDSKYHVEKLKFFSDKGIRIINIFEDEWNKKSSIVKSKLLHILHQSTGNHIYGRHCTIRPISTKECRQFLEHCHIQGFVSAKIYLGAFYKDSLIGCMTFSPTGRFSKGASAANSYELVRYATEPTNRYSGLGGKLLTHFIREYHPKNIVSYADRRFTSANTSIYTTIGFTLAGITPPNYFYTRGSARYNRIKFQKHKLASILPTFNQSLTEWENMKQNGYDRIWDCGHLRYEMSL